MRKASTLANAAFSALVAMIGTLIFEAIKTGLWPRLTGWQSHFIIVAYCTIGVFVISLLGLRLRKRDQARLRVERANFQAVIEHLPGLAWIINSQGKFVHWTDRGMETLGYCDAELSQMTFRDLIAEEDQQLVAAGLQQVFQTGYGELEAAWVTKNGRKVPCYVTAIRISMGGEPCVLGIGIDLSERKQVEEALRRSERQYRKLLANLPDVTWTIDLEGRTIYISPNVEDILGHTPSEVIGCGRERRWQRLHSDDRDAVAKHYHALLADNRIFDVEYRILHNDGRWVWVRNRTLRVYKRNGALYADGILTDISQRKQAELADAQLASIVGSSSDAIIGKSAQGVIQSWNPAAQATFGYSPEEAVGKSMAMLVPLERRRELMEALDKLAAGERIESFDSVCLHKDRSRLQVSLAMSPIVDRTGKVLGISTIARDISLRKQAEVELVKAKEAAEDANRAKTRFLANMSHELRTPMNGILSKVELAMRTTLTAEQRQYLLEIRSSGSALLHLITALLDFTQAEFGSLRLDTRLFLLGETVRQTVRPLFAHAVEFTPQGKIALRAKCQSRTQKEIEVLFTLSDTGIGISPNKHRLISKPFLQSDGSVTGERDGGGLRLAISSRLIELMGGRMWLDSGPGGGSTFAFTVRMGLVPAAVLAGNSLAAGAEAPAGRGQTAGPSRAEARP